jgi:DNA-binding NarL/FixJ family response regulator
MPELDGLEATRRILAADSAARVLILTTFGLDEYVYEALCAGASGFVLKDDPPEQLIAAVRTVAAGNALLSPAITKHVISRFTRIARPAPPKELSELTERETEILRLIAAGLSNAEIGRKLYISETTVKTHVTHILAKLGLRDRVQAVVLAYQAALFEQAPGELPRLRGGNCSRVRGAQAGRACWPCSTGTSPRPPPGCTWSRSPVTGQPGYRAGQACSPERPPTKPASSHQHRNSRSHPPDVQAPAVGQVSRGSPGGPRIGTGGAAWTWSWTRSAGSAPG